MNETEFKAGDVVRLKSGSPEMTIDGFTWNQTKDEYYSDRVDCIWFDGKTLVKQSFKTILLEHD